MKQKIRIAYRSPSIEEYASLREAVEWPIPEKGAMEESLKNALFSVCLEHERELVGLARIVGDNGVYFYIQDMLVPPKHQGKGYALILMEEVMKFLRAKVCEGSFIGLFAAKGVEGLYEKFGFIGRPNDAFGAGMFLPADKLLKFKKE